VGLIQDKNLDGCINMPEQPSYFADIFQQFSNGIVRTFLFVFVKIILLKSDNSRFWNAKQ